MNKSQSKTPLKTIEFSEPSHILQRRTSSMGRITQNFINAQFIHSMVEGTDRYIRSISNVLGLVLCVMFFQKTLYDFSECWTISHAMILPYNIYLSYFLLYPGFFALCLLYGRKLKRYEGTMIATFGGILLVIFPLKQSFTMHYVGFFVTFSSSLYWHTNLTKMQLNQFLISLLFAPAAIIWDANGFLCLIGELGVFTTWAQMMQN